MSIIHLSNKKLSKMRFLLVLIAMATFVEKSQALNLQGYQFSDAYRYSYLDDGGVENFDGKLMFHSSFAHINNPLIMTDSGETQMVKSVITGFDLLSLGTSIRLTDVPLTLGLETAVIKTTLDNSDTNTSLGDTKLKMKWAVIKQQKLSFSLVPEVQVATGSEKFFTSAGSAGAKFRSVLEYHTSNWHYLGSIGYGFFEKNIYQNIDYRRMILTSFGASYDISRSWNVNFETNRDFTVAQDKNQDEGDYYLTFKNSTTERFSTYFGAGIAGTSSTDKQNTTLFLGIKINFFPQSTAPTQALAVLPAAPAPHIIAPPPVQPQPIIIVTKEDEKKMGKPLSVENIYFENNQYLLKTDQSKKVIDVISKLKSKDYAFKHIVIDGFASKVGKQMANKTLSLKRALEVQKMLSDNGIELNKTSVVAFGDESAMHVKEDAKNRRVQFRIY